MTDRKTKYLNIINDLSEDIGMSKEETKNLVDIAISSNDPRYIDYEQLKDEITTFLVINIFFLICKL
jgi:hypothetical protein|tara:strand:+ start:1098 stop:1298 length:201 start_codon:yes stop_codon:yes gene_type:complete